MIFLALMLLWYAVTGGYTGYLNPVLFLINAAGLVILIFAATLTLTERPAGWVDAGLLGLAAVTAFSGFMTGSVPVKAAIWLFFWAIYRISPRWTNEQINQAGLLALVGYMALYPVIFLENSNIIAFNIVSLTILALPAVGLFMLYPVQLQTVMFLLLIWLGRWGGMLVLTVGVSIFFIRWLKIPFAWSTLFGFPGAIIASFRLASTGDRIEIWLKSWQTFLSAPIVGIGPWRFICGKYMHAHNIALTTAAEGGMLGLAALGLLGFAIIKNWVNLAIYAQAVTAALLFWSIFDEPLLFLGSGCVFALSLGGQHDRP